MIPGEIMPAAGHLILNADRQALAVDVENSGDRPIQVGSHFHFFEVNAALVFPRQQAYGKRLDIAAGTAIRFEPGERKRIALIDLAGRRVVHGFNGRVNGPL